MSCNFSQLENLFSQDINLCCSFLFILFGDHWKGSYYWLQYDANTNLFNNVDLSKQIE